MGPGRCGSPTRPSSPTLDFCTFAPRFQPDCQTHALQDPTFLSFPLCPFQSAFRFSLSRIPVSLFLTSPPFSPFRPDPKRASRSWKRASPPHTPPTSSRVPSLAHGRREWTGVEQLVTHTTNRNQKTSLFPTHKLNTNTRAFPYPLASLHAESVAKVCVDVLRMNVKMSLC